MYLYSLGVIPHLETGVSPFYVSLMQVGHLFDVLKLVISMIMRTSVRKVTVVLTVFFIKV